MEAPYRCKRTIAALFVASCLMGLGCSPAHSPAGKGGGDHCDCPRGEHHGHDCDCGHGDCDCSHGDGGVTASEKMTVPQKTPPARADEHCGCGHKH